MGNTPCQGADGLHLVGLAQLGFETLAFGDVDIGLQDHCFSVQRHRRRQTFDPDERPILFYCLVCIVQGDWLAPQMGLDGSLEAREFVEWSVFPNTSPNQFFWSFITQHAGQGRVGKDTRPVPLDDRNALE